MTLSRACAVLAVIFLATVCLPAAAQEKDELWDITMKMEMPGMPMAMPAQTSRMCVAKGANEESFAPQQQGECKTVESKRTGNKYTFKSVCEGKNKLTSVGEVTFGDGIYNGRMQVSGTVEGQPMNMTQTYSGKRVGNCTAPPKPK